MNNYLDVRKIIEQHQAELEVLRNVIEAYESMLRENELRESAGEQDFPSGQFPTGNSDQAEDDECRKSAA